MWSQQISTGLGSYLFRGAQVLPTPNYCCPRGLAGAQKPISNQPGCSIWERACNWHLSNMAETWNCTWDASAIKSIHFGGQFDHSMAFFSAFRLAAPPALFEPTVRKQRPSLAAIVWSTCVSDSKRGTRSWTMLYFGSYDQSVSRTPHAMAPKARKKWWKATAQLQTHTPPYSHPYPRCRTDHQNSIWWPGDGERNQDLAGQPKSSSVLLLNQSNL